jgi:hypothetical protein
LVPVSWANGLGLGRDGERDAIDVEDPRWGFVRSDGWGSTGLSGLPAPDPAAWARVGSMVVVGGVGRGEQLRRHPPV